MKNFTRSNLVASASLAVLALAGMPAQADLISFNLTTANTGVFPPYAGPYATVSINQTDATHATITFASLSSGSSVYNFGGSGANIPCTNSYNATDHSGSLVVEARYASSIPVSFPPFPTTLTLSSKAVYRCEFTS